MDTIETRLRQFIQMEGISPASFADTLGMQRSGITHLLKGRNNPSYDFITKMLQHYPELNADWLLLGKGKPYKSGSHSEQIPEQIEDNIPFDGLFSQSQLSEDEELSNEYAESQLNRTISKVSEPFENPIIVPQPTTDKPILKPEARKTISKIIIFYSDGSYEER